MQEKSEYLKTLWAIFAGPAAGAFGLWLLAEAPVIHRALCTGSMTQWSHQQ